MKILQVISSINPCHGGVSEGVRQLIDESMRQGCPVEVATLDVPGASFVKDFACPVHALGPGFTHFQYCPRFLAWLAANVHRFDIVVVHGLWQYHSVAVRQAARNRNIPYVVYTHGMLDPYFKQNNLWKHAKKWCFWPWADYRVLRDAGAVLFTTDEERIRARQSFWLYTAKEMVVNFGTARPGQDADRQRAAFFARYPELRHKRLAMFLSRIHPKKGCDLAIKAFARVLASDPDWHLIMAGPDQVGWRADLERLAASLGIAEKITWTGMISGAEKWGALRSSEFFFLPSHQENFGVVVAEALACGVPALISDKVNISREVRDFGSGLVAPDTLDGAVCQLQEWLALGSAGQSRMREHAEPCFEQRFEIHQATLNLLQVLRGIASINKLKPAFVNA